MTVPTIHVQAATVEAQRTSVNRCLNEIGIFVGGWITAQIGRNMPGIGRGMLYGGGLIATVSGISAILCLIDEAKAKEISNDPKDEYQKSGAFAGLVELLGRDIALGAVRMKAEGKTNQQIIEATVDQILTPMPPET